MRVLVVAASTVGFRKPDSNSQRTRALRDALARANKSVKLVVVPAGYWTVPDEVSVEDFVSQRVGELTENLVHRGAVLLGGIDVLPAPFRKHTKALVKQHALPFWGFGISDRGKLYGPWRQVSTTKENSTMAGAHAVSEIADRAINVAGRAILPVICGEMHSAGARRVAAEAKGGLVAVFGHSSLGQGLTPSLLSMHTQSSAAVAHVQHLAPITHASVHWVGLDGTKQSVPVSTAGNNFGTPGFWISSHEIVL